MNNLHSLLIALLTGLGAAAHAQPQWRFHLAFEDATGARDTIWYIWDETATLGSWSFQDVDYHLGEGEVVMDTTIFNVWVGNWDGDRTKTVAQPYTQFPSFSPSSPIDGMNYTYPLIIRWDRSLFHASYLPDPDTINYAVLDGIYFYLFANLVPPGFYSILAEDSVVVGLDALWSPLFPTSLVIGHQSGIPGGMDDIATQGFQWSSDGERLRIEARVDIEEVEVLDLGGRCLVGIRARGPVTELPVGHWSPGVYVIRVRTTHHTHHHAKFMLAR